MYQIQLIISVGIGVSLAKIIKGYVFAPHARIVPEKVMSNYPNPRGEVGLENLPTLNQNID